MCRSLLDQSVVNHAIDEWRRHLSPSVDDEGDILDIILMIATLKITTSKWQNCKFANWR